MNIAITIYTGGKEKLYYRSRETRLPVEKTLYEAITFAAASKLSLLSGLEITQDLAPADKGSRFMESIRTDQYVIYDLDYLMMAEHSEGQPALMVSMPAAARLGIEDLQLMQSYKYTLANLLYTRRANHEWLGHANSEMKPLPLFEHSLHYLDDAEIREWEDALKSKIVAVVPDIEHPGHMCFMASGISPHRLQSLHAIITGKIAEDHQWDDDMTAIIDACRSQGDIPPPEYPEDLYAWSFAKVDDMETLLGYFADYDWAIRNTFVHKDLAFVQQVDGGDEWLTLKKTDVGWIPFESYSMSHMLAAYGKEYCADLINKLCARELDYLMDEPPQAADTDEPELPQDGGIQMA